MEPKYRFRLTGRRKSPNAFYFNPLIRKGNTRVLQAVAGEVDIDSWSGNKTVACFLIFTARYMKYRFITIEGNIGAGKTTLAHLLEKHFDARLILEQFADNPFLPKFYADRDKYAFPLELSFLAERFRQLKEVLNTRDLFNQYLISDYLFIKSKLFASVNLPDDEFKLYSTLFDIIQPNLPKPDLLIYLHAPMQKLRENIKQRNRSYEQNIPDEYLQNLQNAYLQLIRSDQYRTLIIDTSQTDFLNNKQQFERLIDYLDQDYEAGFHFLNFSDV